MKKITVKKIFLITAVFLILIAVIPLLFKKNFTLNLDLNVDGKSYSSDMYSVECNRKLTRKSDKYVFDCVEQGDYNITVKSNMNDKAAAILDFVNCQGYDLFSDSIIMDIEIKIDSETETAAIEVNEKNSGSSEKYTVKKNENDEYYVHWTNA